MISIIALAAAVRLPLLFGGLPYIGYVDEGHVLHPVQRLLRVGGWDPGWYQYPSLTIYGIAAAGFAASPVHVLRHGRPLQADLPAHEDLYDAISPPALILTGRLVVLLASLATVVVGTLLARRMGGDGAAVAAGVLLALCPALVQRSTIVIVDTVAALMVTTALLAASELCAATLESGPRGSRTLCLAVAAGSFAGLAATSKYPAGAVLVPVVAAAFSGTAPFLARARLAALAASAAVTAALVTMPALVLRTRGVLSALTEQARFYATPAFAGSPALFRQALAPEELGPVLAGAVILGVSVLVGRRATRPAALAGIAFSVILLVPFLLYPFQPFRNALPVVPAALVAAACLAGDGSPFSGLRYARHLPTIFLAIALLPGLLTTARMRRVRDSRVDLVDFLARPQSAGTRVLVQRELAILPAELARTTLDVTVVSWEEMPALIAAGRADLVVFGVFQADAVSAPPWLDRARAWEAHASALPVVARFGTAHTPVHPNFWRTNDELLVVARAAREADRRE